MSVFDGKLPGQEYLDAILIRRKVGHIETIAAALNDAVRLARVEYHRCAPAQGNAMAQRREMQVQSLVFAQEEIAEGRTAILRTVVVVPGTAAGHQGYVTGGKHPGQSTRAAPVGY